MEIGKNIKRIRREREMTQEQLAEYLNVSTSAVSQWESGKTMPDITLVPVICSLLKASADELLGVDIERREEQIKEIVNSYTEKSRVGDLTGALDILRDGLRRFPDSFELMNFYIISAYGVTATYGAGIEVDEAVKYAEKIIDGCTDPNYRLTAAERLCRYYKRIGDEDRMYSTVRQFPNITDCRHLVLANLLDGSERIEASQTLMFVDLLQFMASRMVLNYTTDEGEPFYTDDEVAELMKKRIELLSLLFERGDYGFYYDDIGSSYTYLAKHHARKYDNGSALQYLEHAADTAIKFIEYMRTPEYRYESLLFRGYTECPGSGVFANEQDNNASLLLAEMADPVFDAIRDDKRFRKVMESLTPLAGKW